MRRKISLYIGDRLADLDDDSFVLVNYSREDLVAPQAILNSFTQTVRLPATGNNGSILGNYYRLDRRTTGSGGTGTAFAALKRTPFVIYDDTACVVMRGYLKLEESTREAYTVTLYGGLGQFLYDLTYAANGDKLTLADCSYQWDGRRWYRASDIYIRCVSSAVIDAWGALRYGAPASGQPFDIINFVPALNGTTYPFKFDAHKAIYHQGATAQTRIPNLYTSATVDGRTYDALGDSGTILMQFGQRHNEWEVQDLRSYCQRPAISLRKMMEGIQRMASDRGYTLNYDNSWWTDNNPYLARVWMTLPYLDRDTMSDMDLSMATAADFLRGTLSPAEYLAAIVKTFGFVLYPSVDGMSINMLLRDNFYRGAAQAVDLTERVDTSTIEVRPYDMDARYYDWETEMAGIFCANYETKYGRRYGSMRLDTGYDFDKNEKVVTASLPWKGCADVVDRSENYRVIVGSADPEYGTATNYLCKFAFTDSVKWPLYYTSPDDNSQQTRNFEPTPMDDHGGMLYAQQQGDMWLALPQLHDESGKAYDKGGVLLFFEGESVTPYDRQGGYLITSVDFAVSDDNADMLAQNGGVPCWDISPVGAGTYRTAVGWVPSFRRWHFVNGRVAYTLDWGDPLEVPPGTGTFNDTCGIYWRYWDNYMTDRLDQDTAVMTADVLLDGMQVSDALLRGYYYYGGAWWALNKILNHSLTTLGPTTCEFVKVQDIDNYTDGQTKFV